MISKILRRNTSPSRIVGFIISNFIGMAIVLAGIQFYTDAAPLWNNEDSFIRSDYLVINKKISSANTLGDKSTTFSLQDTDDIASQPWARRIAPFTACDFRVSASVNTAGHGMSTFMFFESIPDSFVDVPPSQWQYREGSDVVPIILSKDYLTLYNFGFASTAGLPQMSENLMGSIPLTLTLSSEDGTRTHKMHGRVAGFSNRLNTILVPQKFMDSMNVELGSHTSRRPSRIIVDVSSPGDVAITDYLQNHDLEVAGDKSASSASFLLKVVVGIILLIGIIITLLSMFILLLSVSLIMEKNRDKIHSLLMLGYNPSAIARPYISTVTASTIVATLMAIAAVWALRHAYIGAVSALGADSGTAWAALAAALFLTLAIISINALTICRRVRRAFRH